MKSSGYNTPENQAKLHGCKRHDFGELPPEVHLDFARSAVLKCRRCGGELRMDYVLMYREGFGDGGGDRDKVLRAAKAHPDVG